MSTILNTNGATLDIPCPADPDACRVDIVTAKWNSDITFALRDGAIDTLRKAGIPNANIKTYEVPGTVELINAAALLANKETDSADAIIIIGCVIRGDTPHFDYVCQQAAQGAAIINARGKCPLIFGVLTVDTLEQAQQRAGGSLGNKGAEAAVAAIEMSNLHLQVLSH